MRIRELTSLVQKRFGFEPSTVELFVERVDKQERGLCAMAQAESLRYKLLGGLAVRRYVRTRSLPAEMLRHVQGLLRRAAICHGKRSQGMRTDRVRKTESAACEGHEIP